MSLHPVRAADVRIVAGEWRGRRLKVPAGAQVRPTADRVREAWMSIVGPELPGARVVDLFAGSGALGLEALSRGAEHVVFVESHQKSLATLRANAEVLGALDRCTIVRGDALRYAARLRGIEFDVAFADPPYAGGMARQLVDRWLEEPFSTVLGVEHAASEKMPDEGDTRRYGDTAVTFFREAAG
jgi:16S rRNA (guanine966-N2)-methyltransferase